MRIAKSVLLALSLLFLLPAQARAGWFPFTGGSSKNSPRPSKSKSIPIVSSFSNGTKHLVSGTTNILTPKKQTVRQSGTTGVYSSQPKQEKPGFFKSLVHPEPPPPPKTVKEWMQLKKIHP